jgi:general secretion pathway protein K
VIARAQAQARGAHRRQQGFALLIVLWFLVLLAAIGTYMVANARMQTALARNVVAAAKAEALADAGIARAVFNLTDPVPGSRWALDGAPHEVSLPGGTLTIRLGDESAKINPNLATDKLMAALFETRGADGSLARRLGAAIADWVDRDGNVRPNGAEARQYADAGLAYRPPNAPIESLQELQLVLGMTPDLFAAVEPLLTIYTDVSAPDAHHAPPAIRRAIEVAARSATADEGDDSQEDDASDTDDASADPGKPVVVDVEVTARSADGGTFVRRAVLHIAPDEGKGYTVLDWRRGDAAGEPD